MTFFLTLELGDASGRIQANIWDEAVEYNEALSIGDVVTVNARATAYRERLHLKIDAIRAAGHEEYQVTDLLPVVNKDRDELWQQLRSLIKSIQNPL